MAETKIALRHLGQTDIEISPIGLGVMEFSGGGGMLGAVFPAMSREDKRAVVRAALDGGINWFDTAEIYGLGVSEASLADALKACGINDSQVVIATKWWPLLRTARSIPRTVRTRLRYLDGFSIGLYMVHQPFSLSSPEAEMDAMAGLVEAGKIRSVGVSNFSAKRMRRAYSQLKRRGLPLAANQVQYSLLDRSIESNGTLDTARELGVTIIAYTPLASGLLSGKYHQNPALIRQKSWYWRSRLQDGMEKSTRLVHALEEIGAARQATAAQVALNWVIHSQGDIIVAIPGATRAHQAAESAAAANFHLTADEMALLDELSRSNR